MTQRDMAGLLNINVKTLRKWKKDRPKVYEVLMLGLKAEEILEKLKAQNEEFEEMFKEFKSFK